MIETNANPIRSRHNIRLTERSIKTILADGTPAWVSRPQEFKQWAKECYLQEKEESDKLALAYHMDEQETLSDEKPRMIHPMSTLDFIQKLRDHGVNCFTYQVPPGPATPKAMVNTVGLWAEVPSQRAIGHLYRGIRHQYITWLDIPFMWEWSVLRLDPHKIPIGEKYRGWRTVVSKLIAMKVLTEQKAHQIFGEPSGATSKIYRRTLFEFRNGRYRRNEHAISQ